MQTDKVRRTPLYSPRSPFRLSMLCMRIDNNATGKLAHSPVHHPRDQISTGEYRRPWLRRLISLCQATAYPHLRLHIATALSVTRRSVESTFGAALSPRLGPRLLPSFWGINGSQTCILIQRYLLLNMFSHKNYCWNKPSNSSSSPTA